MPAIPPSHFSNKSFSQAMIYWLLVHSFVRSFSHFRFTSSHSTQNMVSKTKEKSLQRESQSHEYWNTYALVFVARETNSVIRSAFHVLMPKCVECNGSNMKSYLAFVLNSFCIDFAQCTYAAHTPHTNFIRIEMKFRKHVARTLNATALYQANNTTNTNNKSIWNAMHQL